MRKNNKFLHMLFHNFKMVVEFLRNWFNELPLAILDNEYSYDRDDISTVDNESTNLEYSEVVRPVMTAKVINASKGVTFIKENPTIDEKELMLQEIISEFGSIDGFHNFCFDDECEFVQFELDKEGYFSDDIDKELDCFGNMRYVNRSTGKHLIRRKDDERG